MPSSSLSYLSHDSSTKIPSTMPASPLPPQEVRDDITVKLADLVRSLQSHPSFTPPEPPRGLFHVWDFVNRSRYIMEELENIRLGKPLRHPEQIPKHEKSMLHIRLVRTWERI